MHIRNFKEAQARVRQFTLQRVLTGLIRQYGLDECLRGLRSTYIESVYSRAKGSEPVQFRAGLLDEVTNVLKEHKHIEKEHINEAV